MYSDKSKHGKAKDVIPNLLVAFCMLRKWGFPAFATCQQGQQHFVLLLLDKRIDHRIQLAVLYKTAYNLSTCESYNQDLIKTGKLIFPEVHVSCLINLSDTTLFPSILSLISQLQPNEMFFFLTEHQLSSLLH